MLAYLDAGSGSVIAAALAGGLAGIAVVLKLFGHRILGIVSPKHRRAAAEARTKLVGDNE